MTGLDSADDNCYSATLRRMTLKRPLVVQIAELIQSDGMEIGAHLPAQMLADRLRVSRSPVNEALKRLHSHGLIERAPNRGYFLARQETAESVAAALGEHDADDTDAVYFQIAEDLLKEELPDIVTESQLRLRYGVTAGELTSVLARIANEGWAERRPGYGWEFSGMIRTPDSLLQSYRLRLALEPAALLEPNYRLDPMVLARCRQAELDLLSGRIETTGADRLHERGVRFHESIVEASGNPFFIDAVRRVNRVRRVLSYRSMQDRERYRQHCEQHLDVLALIEQDRLPEASRALHQHLLSTLDNVGKIRAILGAKPRDGVIKRFTIEA
jgi:DNA-binding GntR family transcriptional regulator